MSTNPDDDMRPEYDFSRAQRGKHFAGADAVFHIPVYLDQDVQAFLMEKAASLWRTLATRYAKEGDYLRFELLNEPKAEKAWARLLALYGKAL